MLKKIKIMFMAQVVFLCMFVSLANAGMSSTSFSIPTMVITGGGNTMTSSSFTMVSTLGQPTVLGNGSSTSYNSYPGFWYTLFTIALGDINGDGTVNLEDVISALQVVTGQTVESVFLQADVNGDGGIGVAEAIMILRKVGNL